jgi:membrane protein
MSSQARLEELRRDLAALRGPERPATTDGRDDRGSRAAHPAEIPPRGWKDVLRRVWTEVSDANLFLVAGGVTYAILLALFPGLAALISIYGLVFDASQVEKQIDVLAGVLPAESLQLLSDEVHKLVEA